MGGYIELLRIGTVGVASTPLATTPAHRLSFAGDVHRGRSQDALVLDAGRTNSTSICSVTATHNDTDEDDEDEDDSKDDDDDEEEEQEEEDTTTTLPQLLVISTSLRPNDPQQSVPQSAAITEATTRSRSSYMTNDTGTNSRISGLSDFPVPPNQTEPFKCADEQSPVAGPSPSRPEREEPEAR